MKKSKIFKHIILIVNLIFLLLIFSISATWLFSGINNTNQNIGIRTDETCTITIYTRTQSSELKTTTTYQPGPTANDWTIIEKSSTTETSDSGNIFTHGQKHKVGQILDGPSQISSTSETLDDGTIINTYIYQRETVYEIGDEKTSTLYKRWWYKRQKEQRTEVVTISRDAPIDAINDKSITIKTGTKLTPFDLSLDGYKQYGYYADSDYTTFFDFSTPITSDTNIYIKYTQGESDLSDLIAGSSNTTINLYDSLRGGSSGTYDVFSDMGYDEKTRTIYLDSTEISTSTTVNLTYDAGQIYQSPNTGAVNSSDLALHRTTTDTSIALDYDGNTYIGDRDCFLSLKLTGDLYIQGTMNIGAKIGGHSVNDYYSYIIGGYTQIDLNGYNIIVDGGHLCAYGAINDSTGTGQIIVKNNGKVTGVLTVTDGRGRDQTPLGYGKGQTPFTEYKLAYINVPIKLMAGTSLESYLKLDLLNLGISNIIFNIIGSNQTTSIFSWSNSNPNDYVMFTPYEISLNNYYPVTDRSTQSNNIYYKEMYYSRFKVDIYANIQLNKEINLNAKVILNTQSADLNIDLTRVDVPISPYFDINLKSSFSLDLYSKLTLYPGSSFTTEKGSNLNFKFRGNTTYPELGKKVLGQELIIPSETRYISGGIIAYTKNLNEYSSYNPSGNGFGKGLYAQSIFWQNINPNNHRIEGNITFDESITDYYYISGPIDISENGINAIKDIANKGKLKTYDMKIELYGGFWFNANNTSTTKTYEKAVYFNTVPLISLSKAYIYDGIYQIEGTYDLNNGVFETNQNGEIEFYFLKVDTDLYETGSSGKDQSSPIDRNVTIEKISKVINNAIIKDENGSSYAYYCGIYVPILEDIDETTTYTTLRVNARKFFSNREANTEVAVNAPYYDDVTIIWNGSRWRFSKFTNKA